MLNSVTGPKCTGKGCRRAKVKTFLDLKPEQKLKELFSDKTFLSLLKKGKAQERHKQGTPTEIFMTYMTGWNIKSLRTQENF